MFGITEGAATRVQQTEGPMQQMTPDMYKENWFGN